MSGCGSHRRPQTRNHRGSIPSDPNFRSLGLIAKSHEPGDILLEVQNFASNPDYIQKDYKRDFVEIYKRWRGMSTPNGLTCGFWGLELEKDLQSAMEALDAFFFAGCLTRPHPYAMYGERRADLKVQRNIFAEGEAGHQVYLNIGLPVLGVASLRSDGWTTIYIDTLNNGYPRTVTSMFETLVHEVAHAIFLSFACGGEHWKRMQADPRIIGRRGHGDMWAQMANFMKMNIQKWDFDLANFYNTGDIERNNKEVI